MIIQYALQLWNFSHQHNLHWSWCHKATGSVYPPLAVIDRFPWPGIEPGPRRWERRILTTRPPGITCSAPVVFRAKTLFSSGETHRQRPQCGTNGKLAHLKVGVEFKCLQCIMGNDLCCCKDEKTTHFATMTDILMAFNLHIRTRLSLSFRMWGRSATSVTPSIARDDLADLAGRWVSLSSLITPRMRPSRLPCARWKRTCSPVDEDPWCTSSCTPLLEPPNKRKAHLKVKRRQVKLQDFRHIHWGTACGSLPSFCKWRFHLQKQINQFLSIFRNQDYI